MFEIAAALTAHRLPDFDLYGSPHSAVFLLQEDDGRDRDEQGRALLMEFGGIQG